MAMANARGRKKEDLEALLGELEEAAKTNGARVSLEEVMDAIGRRSFGPLLLVVGLLGMTPVAAVPGAPTVLAVVTVLIAGQLLFGRKSFWLPKVLLKLSVKSGRMKKTVKVASTPAHAVDRVVKPRLQALTGPVADRLVALMCILLACAVPPLELLPLAAFLPAAAIAAFGLGLVARDGLVVLVAFILSAGAVGLVGYQILT
jgi:hypothetical protein